MNSADHNLQRFERAITNLRRAITQAKERGGSVLALSRTQLEIMLLLREHDSQTTTQLAKQLFLTPGAVTQTIETLVQRELIERLPDNNDRRLIHLRLSPAGTEAINRVIQQRRKRMKALLTQLSPPELEALIIGAERLAQLIEQDTDTNESPA